MLGYLRINLYLAACIAMEIEQNNELRLAWDFVEHTGRSIFLTGKAGTGKTTFLRKVVEKSRKRTIVVAPTGVAAINAGGVTIHSFFQLPFTPFVPGVKIDNKYDFSRDKRKIIASIDLLIIDEISMVRADLLDAIDSVLRRYREHHLPFGGVQLLLIGDLAQLTPVVTPEDERLLSPHYNTPYFFGSKALGLINYVTIQLEHVYRQQDMDFIDILNQIRGGRLSEQALALLNRCYRPGFEPNASETFIRLTTHNNQANTYNDNKLNALPDNAFQFQAQIKGTFPDYSYPTSEMLVLKRGAQVMFVKNDPSSEHRYYNGRIGVVDYIDENQIVVSCDGDDEPIAVEQLEWENTRYTLNEATREIEAEVLGTFRQYPLRLAWAITIHKSQGLTFEHAIIDANYAFAPGQVYVALSRCRTLQGLVLAAPLDARAIISDERVGTYIAQQGAEAQRSIEQLPSLKQDYERQLLLQLFDFRSIALMQETMVRLFSDFFYSSHSLLKQEHDQALHNLRLRVMDVADRWRQKISTMPADELRAEDFLERVKRSADYFADTLNELLARPIQLSAEVQSNNKQAASRLKQTLPELRQAWLARRYLLSKIAEHGFSVPFYLREKQMSMLDALDEDSIKPKTQRKHSRRGKLSKIDKDSKEPKVKTWQLTYGLFQNGLSPDAIARERSLTLETVMGHLLRYVESGELPLVEVVPPDRQRLIEQAMAQANDANNAYAIKKQCAVEVSTNEVRMVLSALRADQTSIVSQ